MGNQCPWITFGNTDCPNLPMRKTASFIMMQSKCSVLQDSSGLTSSIKIKSRSRKLFGIFQAQLASTIFLSSMKFCIKFLDQATHYIYARINIYYTWCKLYFTNLLSVICNSHLRSRGLRSMEDVGVSGLLGRPSAQPIAHNGLRISENGINF